MTSRHYSFGQYREGAFDRLLFLLRTRLVRKELRNTPSLRSILDIGCGYHAVFLRMCKRLFPTITTATGIDLKVSPELKAVGITAIESDINQPFSCTPGTFDVAVSTALFEHLNNPESAAREAFKALKPGGKLIATTPAPSAKPVLEFMALKLKLIDPVEILDHKNYFTKEALKDLFTKAGFKEVRVRRFFFGFNTLTIAQK